MLYPFFLILVADSTLFFFRKHSTSWLRVVIIMAMTFLASTFLILVFIPGAVLPELVTMRIIEPNLNVILVLSGLAVIGLLFWMIQGRRGFVELFLVVFVALLLIRTVFDFTVIPYRYGNEKQKAYSDAAKQMGSMTKGAPLKLVFHDWNHENTYYVEHTREEILPLVVEIPKKDIYYIVPYFLLKNYNFEVYYRFRVRFNNWDYYLVKLQN
jgi:hypothetical protein